MLVFYAELVPLEDVPVVQSRIEHNSYWIFGKRPFVTVSQFRWCRVWRGRDLIERRPPDMRSHGLVLRGTGRNVTVKIEKIFAEHDADLFAGLSPFFSGLRALLAGLTAMRAKASEH